MKIINPDPLYKLFCISMTFLIPLLPAILLYEITPKDNFKTNGTLGSFKINATGASALYIVLFAAFFTKVDSLIVNIDAFRKLQESYNQRPWRIDWKVKLMLDPKHEANALLYKSVLDNSSINCIPESLHCYGDTKKISFYIEDKTIQDQQGKLSGMLVLNNKLGSSFGSSNFDWTQTELDTIRRVITINSILTKQSNRNYLTSQVIDTTRGSTTAPKPQ